MNKQLNPRQIKTIQNFWTWFQDNEQAIYHAYKLGINSDEVIENLHRNLNYVSKRIVIYIYTKTIIRTNFVSYFQLTVTVNYSLK